MNLNRNDQEYLVQKIRSQYTEKEYTELDNLKKLDSKVKKPIKIFAYLLGSVSALVMGGGMSLIMTDINDTVGLADPMKAGLAIGVAGLAMAAVNYPIYKNRLNARRKKYAEEVITLSDRLMQSGK